VLKRKQYETETNQGRNNEMIKKWKSDIDNLMK
jgi:Holliday junction resolvase RusA-like endonuclease